MQMRRTKILGTGAYVPEKVLTNFDVEKLIDTTDEWIVTRSGISERRIAAPDEATSDLALPASLRALEAAAVSPEDLDAIIVATITPDTVCPAAACWLQAKLGNSRAFAFDVTAACSGFVFGLSVADQYLRSGTARRVLLVGAEVMTRVVNWTDRESCFLWGDGAGAVVLGPAEEGDDAGILSVHLHSDGRHGEKLLVPGGGSRTTPISHESVDRNLHTLRIEGRESFKIAVRAFTEVCLEALRANDLTVDDIAVLLPHQANLRIIESVADKVKIPMDKVYVNIHRLGNMSAATVPIALDEVVRGRLIKPSDLLLMATFGGGLTWGAAVVRL